jgi:hypothetical protein
MDAAHQIERSRRREERRWAEELDVPEASAFRLAQSGGQHGPRSIDGDDGARACGERQRQPPDSAAVLERRHRREVRSEPLPDDVEEPVDQLFAPGKELPLELGREIRAQELRGGEHGEVRLGRGERLNSRVGRRCVPRPSTFSSGTDHENVRWLATIVSTRIGATRRWGGRMSRSG